MQKRMHFFSITALLLFVILSCESPKSHERHLKVSEYLDKMKAGWIGQMVGVGFGGPTEFHWQGKIIPQDSLPVWKPDIVNQFQQDDIYVEMTFLATLERYGIDATARQAGIDFANSRFRLWHANRAGRHNLRAGIAPPNSGHPKFNQHADDIDYQIEADYSGLISPGAPNMVIDLGERIGSLMNYGDGLYGGQFVGAMYSAAFFETDPDKIVRAGLAAIPNGSQYHECISDVLKWFKENPNDWQNTWQLVNEKYYLNPDYRKFSCSGSHGKFDIDAKLNGAYIVMGLLYGNGDIDKTLEISTRCGQDSDCNPSNAAGILFASIGYSNLPQQFTSALNDTAKFSHTEYDLRTVANVCEKLARQVVEKIGGRIDKNAEGEEEFIIPYQKPKPSNLVQAWNPEPVKDNYYTQEEKAMITVSEN